MSVAICVFQAILNEVEDEPSRAGCKQRQRKSSPLECIIKRLVESMAHTL